MLSALRDVLEVDVKRVAFGVMAISTAMAMGCGSEACPAGSVMSEGRCVTEGVDAGTDVGERVDTGPAADVGPPDAPPIDAPTFDVGPIDVGPPGMDSGMPDAFVPPDTAIDAFTPFDVPQPDACVTATYYADADGDTFGNASASMTGCVMPAGYVTNSMDCNDGAAVIRPGATEVCNGVDDNCAGGIDEGVQMTLYVDADGDNYGGATTALACTPRAGLVAMTGDCNDSAAPINPGAAETCDGMDNNCSGTGDTPTFVCTRNAPSTPCTTTCGSMGVGTCTSSCTAPTGASCTPPAETCNGRDDDCDGRSDESLVTVGAAMVSSTNEATATYLSPLLVPVSSGFVVVYRGDGASEDDWRVRSVNDAGVVGSAARVIASTGVPYGHSARFDGTNVVFAYRDGAEYKVLAFNPTTAATVWGPFTLPRSASLSNVSKIADATATRATIFYAQTSSIRRVRLGIAGTTVTAITTQDITGVGSASVFDVIATSTGDVVAYTNSAQDLLLTRGPTADAGGAFAALGTVRLAASEPNIVSVGFALRDPSMAVSATNPIGLVWQRNLVGSYFLPITQTAPLAMGTLLTVGATGRPSYFGTPDFVDISAVPGSTGSHFYITTIEDDAAMSANAGTLNVVEVSSASRSIVVSSELTSLRNGVSLARSASGQFRVASETPTGVATRSIGCP